MIYDILVNKYNKLYEELIDTNKLVEYHGEYRSHSLLIEKTTLKSFLKFKDYVYKTKKITMDLKTGYISPEETQILYDLDKEKNGKEHADKCISFLILRNTIRV